MKIQFDSNQEYQLDAIQAVVDIFDGQPSAQGEYEIRLDATGGDMLTQLGVGNNLVLDESRILANLQRVQERNEIDPVSTALDGMNFSTEMETGTGKTYWFSVNWNFVWFELVRVGRLPVEGIAASCREGLSL